MESKRWKKLTESTDKSEKQQNNVIIHECFNQFTYPMFDTGAIIDLAREIRRLFRVR